MTGEMESKIKFLSYRFLPFRVGQDRCHLTSDLLLSSVMNEQWSRFAALISDIVNL